MAEPAGMAYVATQPVNDPATGARAYNPGDLVHESALEDGTRLGLELGVNVAQREGIAPSRPGLDAPQAVWVNFAISQGCPRDQAEGMTRAQLIGSYGTDEQQAAVKPPPAKTRTEAGAKTGQEPAGAGT